MSEVEQLKASIETLQKGLEISLASNRKAKEELNALLTEAKGLLHTASIRLATYGLTVDDDPRKQIIEFLER